VHSALSQCVHTFTRLVSGRSRRGGEGRDVTCFGTDSSHFGSGAVTHLLGQCSKVDSSLEGHLEEMLLANERERGGGDEPFESGFAEWRHALPGYRS
jgi:hypothetical protein